MEQREIKALIFDMDGTLIDSMGIWGEIDVEFLGKRGLEVPDDYLKAITPLGFQGAAEYTIRRFGFKETPQELEEEWLQMAEEAYAHNIEMKPGAKDFLRKCHKAGYKMAIATSSLERLYKPCFLHHEVMDLFETVITTKDAGKDKNNPRIYELAAERLKVDKEECLIFEDIEEAILTAVKAGFKTVGVEDGTDSLKNQRVKELADYYISSYEGAYERLNLRSKASK